MRTKKTRVRVKDIKAGVTLYIAHPIYGIEKVVAASRPFTHRFQFGGTADFFKTVSSGLESLKDAGISKGESYNGRRTFKKLKHAEDWCIRMAIDRGFILQHEQHEESMRLSHWED